MISQQHADQVSQTQPAAVRPFTLLGAAVIAIFYRAMTFLGGIYYLLWDACLWALRGLFLPNVKFGWTALFAQMVRVGVRAIPIVLLVGLTIGLILPLQMAQQLDRYGQKEQVATINAIAAFRELGALMSAIVLSGFAGASIAAELGAMVTTEEISALRAHALNPIRYLVVPRVIATVVMTLCLTVMADLIMIFGGLLSGWQLGIDPVVYYDLSVQAVNIRSFITGLVKGGVFGLLIALIACFLGLRVQFWHGSEGVGRATTNTVVYSIVAIIVFDALFTVAFYAYGFFR